MKPGTGDRSGEGTLLCPHGAAGEARKPHSKQLYTSKQTMASALGEEQGAEQGPRCGQGRKRLAKEVCLSP